MTIPTPNKRPEKKFINSWSSFIVFSVIKNRIKIDDIINKIETKIVFPFVILEFI